MVASHTYSHNVHQTELCKPHQAQCHSHVQGVMNRPSLPRIEWIWDGLFTSGGALKEFNFIHKGTV